MRRGAGHSHRHRDVACLARACRAARHPGRPRPARRGAHAAAGDLTMSNHQSPERPDETRLSAWLDGELDATAQAQVEAWLRDHPEDAAQARLWAADRDALRARFDPVLDEPIPPALLQALRPAAQPAGRAAPAPRARWRLAAMVAGLLLTGGLAGGYIGAHLAGGDGTGLAALPLPWVDAERVRPGGWTHRDRK